MSISDNPLLGPEWQPLGHVLMRLIEDLRNGAHFSVQTYGRKYNMSPSIRLDFVAYVVFCIAWFWDKASVNRA